MIINAQNCISHVMYTLKYIIQCFPKPFENCVDLNQAEARKHGLQHHICLVREIQTLLLANNKGADQPAHPRSLVSAFVIHKMKGKNLGQIPLISTFLVGFNMIKSLTTPLSAITS